VHVADGLRREALVKQLRIQSVEVGAVEVDELATSERRDEVLVDD
jgi:hypothetical protein